MLAQLRSGPESGNSTPDTPPDALVPRKERGENHVQVGLLQIQHLRRCSRSTLISPEPREDSVLKHLRFAEIEDIASARIRFRGVLDALIRQSPAWRSGGSPRVRRLWVRLKRGRVDAPARRRLAVGPDLRYSCVPRRPPGTRRPPGKIPGIVHGESKGDEEIGAAPSDVPRDSMEASSGCSCKGVPLTSALNP